MLPGKVYTPDVVLKTAWRYKWVILLPFVLATGAVVTYSNSLPDLFRSETLILVVPQRISESYVRATVSSRIEDRLRSMREQILSRTRLEQVIQEFDLYAVERLHKPMEEIVEVMTRQITVEPIRSDSFRIAFVAQDAAIPVQVTTRLAAMFIEENQRDRTVLAEDTNDFLESQREAAKVRLVEHERKLEAFRLQHAGELPSQMQSNLQVIQTTQTQVHALAESINRDRDRRLLLEKSLGDVQGVDYPSAPSSLGNGQGADNSHPADPLEAARRVLVALETRLKPDHPDVIAQRRVVQQLERQVSATPAAQGDEQPAMVPNTAGLLRQSRIRQIQIEIDKIDAQMAVKERETQRLQKVIDDYQKRVEAIPTLETEMTELMRDYDTLQRIYTGLLAKKEDSNLAASLERQQIGEQFKILDAPRRAERPFSPNRLRMNLIGALGGLLLGLSFAGLLEYRDTSLRTEEDIAGTLSLPVLAAIPFMMSPTERRRRYRNGALLVGGTITTLGCLTAVLWQWRG